MATRRSDTLEVVYIDVQVRDADVKRGLEGIGKAAQVEARKLGTAFSREATPGMNGAATAARALKDRQKELDAEVQRLSLSVRNQRNAYVQGRITQDQYKATTASLKGEINTLLDSTNDLSIAQQTRLNTSAATAERGLATLRGEASRLGLAQQVQIGLTNTFGNQLRSLGPAGAAAAGGLGLIQGGFQSLRAPLDASTFSFDRFIGLAARAPQVIALATAALGTLAVVGLTRLANQAAQVADEIDKASQSVGLAAEEYQELTFALTQSGVAKDRVRTALGNLNTRVGEAIRGNERYATTLKNLGVDLEEVRAGTIGIGDVLGQVADGIAGLPTPVQQAEAAATLFGRTLGNQLLPALQQGSEGLGELRQRARDLGLVISGDAIISLVAYKDEVEALEQQFETARVEIGAAFLPVLRDLLIPLLQNTLVPLLQTVAQRVSDVSRTFVDAGPAGQAFRDNIAQAVAPLVALGQIAVTSGAAVLGSLQAIAGGAAQLGAFLGTLIAQTETAVQRLARISPLLADLTSTNVFTVVRAAQELQGMFQQGAFSNPFDIGEARRAGQEAGQGYYEAALSSFETAGAAATFDLRGFLENLSSEARAAVERGGFSFDPFEGSEGAGGDAGAASGRAFVEGSLAALRQARAEARTAFEEAGDDAGRGFAQALVDELDAAIEVIERRFRAIDVRVTPTITIGDIDSRRPAFTPPRAPDGLFGSPSDRLREVQRGLRETDRAARVAAFALTQAERAQREYTDSLRASAGTIASSAIPQASAQLAERIGREAEERFLQARLARAAEISAALEGGGPPVVGQSFRPFDRGALQSDAASAAEDTVRALVEARAPLADIATAFDRLQAVGGGADAALAAVVRSLLSAGPALAEYQQGLEGLAQAGRAEALAQAAAAAARLEAAEATLGSLRIQANAALGNVLTSNQALIANLGELSLELEEVGLAEAAEEVRDLADAINQLDARSAADKLREDADRAASQAQQQLISDINKGVSATNQFASAVRDLAEGNAGGVGGLFGAAGTIASFFGPTGSIVGAILGGFGTLFSTLLGGQSRRPEVEGTRAAGASARGAPSIELNFTYQQSLSLASLTDPESRRALGGAADDAFERFQRVIDTLFARVERLEARA